MNPLISVHELASLIGRDQLLIVDCRKELSSADSGRIAHAAAHIPGAVYADLDTDLSDLSRQGLGRHPLPHETAFSALLSRWGWTPQHSLVAYDDAGGALAATRLWWMMRLVGADDVRVLDGGWSAWMAADQPVKPGQPQRNGGSVAIRFDPNLCVDYRELQTALHEEAIFLLDARGGPRYRGEVEPLDRVPGHIPGAHNRPFTDNLEANGHFKPARQLGEEFRALIGAYSPASVVHMCGSGVTACHNLLAMELAGLHGSRLFVPSWSGWISDPQRPVAVGAAP